MFCVTYVGSHTSRGTYCSLISCFFAPRLISNPIGATGDEQHDADEENEVVERNLDDDDAEATGNEAGDDGGDENNSDEEDDLYEEQAFRAQNNDYVFMEGASHEDRRDSFLTYTDLDASRDNSIDPTVGFFTTDAGDTPLTIEHDYFMESVSGHVLLNQAAVCTSRFDKEISSTQRQRHFIQRFCATTPGQSCPLLSIEASLFPRMFYASAKLDSYAVLGALPTWLVGQQTRTHGFAQTVDTIRSRLTASGSLTSTCPHYCKHLFDVMSNMALSKGDSRQIINRGFQVDANSPLGLRSRNSEHSTLTECVDSQEMVRGLSASQKYIRWGWFITFTQNQSETPGLNFIHHWKRLGLWKRHFPGYYELSPLDQQEIDRGVEEASGFLIFRNWVEVRTLVLQYFKDHLTFLGANVAIFSRDEYQEKAGNPFHEHLVMAIDTSSLSRDAEKSIVDLLQTSVMEIVRTDEMQSLIDKGLLKSVDDVLRTTDLASKFLAHRCSARCLRRIGPGDGPENFRCRKLHAVWDSPDPTRHQYIPLPVNLSEGCKSSLVACGLCTVDEDGKPEYHHPYFKPHRHMAPCNRNARCNMSPTPTELFLLLRSMVNAQWMGHSNGIAKYLLKYVGKFDQGNRATASANPHTGAIRVGQEFLHNTKIASSRINEDKAFERRRNKHHPIGRDYPILELYHLMLGLPEVTTNLRFINICTLPFEVRKQHLVNTLDARGNVVRGNTPGEEVQGTTASGRSGPGGRRRNGFDAHRSGLDAGRVRESQDLGLHREQRLTASQELTLRDDRVSSRKFCMISVFGLRPPELVGVFETLGTYFRYCHIEDKPHSVEAVKERLSNDLRQCRWIDCYGRQVYIRQQGLAEVRDLVEENLRDLATNPYFDSRPEERQFRIQMNEIVRDMMRVEEADENSLSEEDAAWKQSFGDFIHDDGEDLLPIPVMTDVNPSNTQQFFIHLVLSLGKYTTEIDALHRQNPRETLEATRLIGTATDEASRLDDINNLLYKYIVEQVVYFSHALRRADGMITQAHRILEDVIMHNEFPLNEIPFLTTELYRSTERKHTQFWQRMKQCQLDSIYALLTDESGNLLPGIPPRERVESATRYDPVRWNPIDTMEQARDQSRASFDEQKVAVHAATYSINKYNGTVSGHRSLTYTKNVVVHGAPGSGKSFVGQTCVLYAIAQGLRCISTALMGPRASALGGIHYHRLFCLPVKKGAIRPYRCAELAMQKIMKNSAYHHALLTVDVIFLDEAGQCSAELLAAFDIILRKLRKSQTPFGGVLFLGSMDHAQIPPINALPFLMSSLVLTSFSMVQLKESVRAHADTDFQDFQRLIRKNPFDLRQNDEDRRRFFHLARTLFKYVRDWSDPRIKSNMAHVFSRKAYVRSATDLYTDELIRKLRAETGADPYVRTAEDSQVRSNTVADTMQASEQTVRSLNNKLREPERLVISPWCVYEITTNDREDRYNYSNIALLVDMPDTQRLNNWDSFPVFVAPSGPNRLDFLEEGRDRPTKEQLRLMGWREVQIGTTPERNVSVRGGLQARRKQYSLKHIGAMTIDKSQGDTIPGGLAVEISGEGMAPWSKSQIVVVFSRTKTAGATIIVGEMEFAINHMWELITKPTQWSLMMENILSIVTINGTDADANAFPWRYELDIPRNFPFRVCDAFLPTDDTGFVYILISLRDESFTYIGETDSIVNRLRNHNSGHGAIGTANPADRPFAVAAYISGLAHYDRRQRMSLENQWRYFRNNLDVDDPFEIINQGRRIVQNENAAAARMNRPEIINFVRLVRPAFEEEDGDEDK